MITVLHQDDPYAFPSQNIKVENENLVYFWFGWKFGVTNDGGKTWTIWDAEKDDLIKQSIYYGLIESVTIQPDGKGQMLFSDSRNKLSGAAHLKTEDFGKTWHR